MDLHVLYLRVYGPGGGTRYQIEGDFLGGEKGGIRRWNVVPQSRMEWIVSQTNINQDMCIKPLIREGNQVGNYPSDSNLTKNREMKISVEAADARVDDLGRIISFFRMENPRR